MAREFIYEAIQILLREYDECLCPPVVLPVLREIGAILPQRQPAVETALARQA